MPTPSELIVEHGLDLPIPKEVNGQQNRVDNDPAWDAQYTPCTEAFPEDDVATGTVTKISDWQESTIYPGTSRDLWLYKPTGVEADEYRLIFFNDGPFYLSRSGSVRATNVLDTLHHQGDIPATAAVFILPGRPDHSVPGPIEAYDDLLSQRSLEYDRLGPEYGEFLFGEIKPLVESELGIVVGDDPSQRTVCGISSGGIAAFTAAWQHPHECSRVISHCGSFTDIWGGHNYHSLIRRTPRKDIRVFLQSGENDADTPFGHWPSANQGLAAALAFAGYDHRFEFGTGGHNLCHGGAIFADTLRWLWRD